MESTRHNPDERYNVRPSTGPRVRYPLLLGGLGVAAFLGLIIIVVIVVRVTAPADEATGLERGAGVATPAQADELGREPDVR